MADYKEKWLSRLKEIIKENVRINDRKSPGPKEYREELNSLCDQIITQTIDQTSRMLRETLTDDQKNGIKETIFDPAGNNPYSRRKGRLINFYSDEFNIAAKLQDERLQEDAADLREKTRFIIFRIATAMGIGATVLATYSLAHTLQIPIAFLRIS